jgi:hypothetical protein
MKKFKILILIIIWLLALLTVKLKGLDISPQSVGFDEAALGYNAYSLMLTGKDEYGTRLPLSLRSYNDFKPALYSYLAIPFIKIFGLTDAAIRMPSAVMGTISLLFLLLIIRKIGRPRNLTTDILIVTIISFFPWRLHFSRVAFETNVSMAFFTGMVWCLLNYGKNKFYKIGLIAFATFSVYSYHSSRMSVPVLLFLFLADPLNNSLKDYIKKPYFVIKKLWPLLIIALCYLPLFLESNAGLLLTRYKQTNLFSHFYPFTPSELQMGVNIFSNPIANPIYYLSAHILGNLTSYLSPKNLSLLIYPGVIKSAQAIAGSGMLGFTGGMLFAVGLLTHFKDFIIKKNLQFIAYWAIAGIIPAALTWEWFYPLRSLNAFAAFDLVAALGLIYVIQKISNFKNIIFKLTAVGAFSLILILTSIYNLLNEYNYGASITAGEFQPGGFKEGVPVLMSLKDNYKTIYLDSNQAQSYEIFWYYMKYPPEKVQAIADKRNPPGTEGPPTIDFENFIFKKFNWPEDKELNNFLYWTSSEVKEDEIAAVPGAKLYKIISPAGNWIASIVTKQ